MTFKSRLKCSNHVYFIFMFHSINHTCKNMYRDQNHDFMLNSTKFMRRNAAKRWKLAVILDFCGHFYFFHLTAWYSNQNCSTDPYLQICTKNLHYGRYDHYHGQPTIMATQRFSGSPLAYYNQICRKSWHNSWVSPCDVQSQQHNIQQDVTKIFKFSTVKKNKHKNQTLTRFTRLYYSIFYNVNFGRT